MPQSNYVWTVFEGTLGTVVFRGTQRNFCAALLLPTMSSESSNVAKLLMFGLDDTPLGRLLLQSLGGTQFSELSLTAHPDEFYELNAPGRTSLTFSPDLDCEIETRPTADCFSDSALRTLNEILGSSQSELGMESETGRWAVRPLTFETLPSTLDLMFSDSQRYRYRGREFYRRGERILVGVHPHSVKAVESALIAASPGHEEALARHKRISQERRSLRELVRNEVRATVAQLEASIGDPEQLSALSAWIRLKGQDDLTPHFLRPQLEAVRTACSASANLPGPKEFSALPADIFALATDMLGSKNWDYVDSLWPGNVASG